MNSKLLVLLIEDSKLDTELVIRTLTKGGFDVQCERVSSADAVRKAVTQKPWHIIISDYAMPGFNGLDALAIVRETHLDVPFILISGTVGEDTAVLAMKSGAQDYVMKGNLTRLPMAVKRELQEAQRRREERKKARERAETEERLKQFKRFFSPQIADMIISRKLDDPFKWHRKDISVLFIDLRGFTHFVEISKPENVMDKLQEYYASIGKAAQNHYGTIGHVAGDGIMVFFNDPVDSPEHPQQACRMALECRDIMRELCSQWRRQDLSLDFGAGIASGHATIGGLGAEGCWDYSVIGTAANLAARLCGEAKHGQILVPQPFTRLVHDFIELESAGQFTLKGFDHPVSTYNILQAKP